MLKSTNQTRSSRRVPSGETHRETNENECPIAQAEEILRARGKKADDVVQQKRVFAFLRDATGAAGTFEYLAHNEMLGECGEFSKPAAWWAFEIDAKRRAIVAGARRLTTQDAIYTAMV